MTTLSTTTSLVTQLQRTDSLSFGDSSSCCCNTCQDVCTLAAQATMGTGVLGSTAGLFAAGTYYGAYWLVPLFGLSGAACAIGYYYIHKYRTLKKLSDISNDVSFGAQQIAATAVSVGNIAAQEIQNNSALVEEEKRTQQDLETAQSHQKDTIHEISSLRQTVVLLQKNNQELFKEKEQMQKQIDTLKYSLKSLTEQIEKFKNQNKALLASIQQMGIHIEHFDQEEKELTHLNDNLEHTTVQLGVSLQVAHTNIQNAFEQLKRQKEELQAQVEELATHVDKFGKIEVRLNEEIERKQKIEQEIVTATKKLNSLKDQFNQLKKDFGTEQRSMQKQNQQLRVIQTELEQERSKTPSSPTKEIAALDALTERLHNAITPSPDEMEEAAARQEKIKKFLENTP